LLQFFFIVLWKLWEIDVLRERGSWWIHGCSWGTQRLEAGSLIYFVLQLGAWGCFRGYRRGLCLYQGVEGGSLNSCFESLMLDVFSREDESDDAWHVIRQGYHLTVLLDCKHHSNCNIVRNLAKESKLTKYSQSHVQNSHLSDRIM
jgi:hypothetical protein